MTRPTFLVIGAYKSGTTSLDRYLRAHPDVFLPPIKEPSYFAFAGDVDSDRPRPSTAVTDPLRYYGLFDAARGEHAVGEVSPEYLVHPAAPGAIARELPQARLVAILRNPIERAYSDYLMYVRDGRERLDFAGALAVQAERARQGDPMGHYVDTGFYGRQLRRVYDHFDRAHVRVYLLEDLVADVHGLLHDVFEYLCVDASFVPPDLREHNVSGVPRTAARRAMLSARHRIGPYVRRVVPTALKTGIDRRLEAGLDRPPLPEECRRMLVDTYRDDIEQLGDLLGRDLGGWIAPT